MLKSLSIRNYVLIDELDVHFDDGFSVITGETGAGKSIILGALSLVLGERADVKSIRAESDKCVIEAAFDLSMYGLEAFFEANELEYDAAACLLRRELYSSGKSRAFINDSPVQLSVVKELGNKLVDVHSQHQNLLLADAHFQLNVVDLMSGNGAQLLVYRKAFEQYTDICETITALTNKINAAKSEEDYIRFQYEELKSSQLQSGETEELEEELNALSHTEEIKNALYRVTGLLNGEDRSVVSSLKEALTAVEQLSGYYPKSAEYADRLRSAYIELNDLASETDVAKDDVEFSPERLEWINDRLNMLYSLQRKHKVSTADELIIIFNEFETKLNAIDSFDGELEKLTQAQSESFAALMEQAAAITKLRKNAAANIETTLMESMALLGMANTRFSVDFSLKSKLSADGMDEIRFLFAANRNEPLRSVADTASGGEISRLMLCIKAIIAGYAALPSIIFDEVDAGVSGEIADKMAEIMRRMAEKMQVITITHLPQIAAKGKAHYYVYKEDAPDRTLTRIRKLTSEERIREIARMLSGSQLTQFAVDNAKSLLETDR